MTPGLYLDTARLGRMCPGARGAEQDFATLVSQLGSSLYLERFLTDGFCTLPGTLRKRVPRLRGWQGVAGLKCRLGQLVGQPAESPTLLFSQSNCLIQFAADCLFDSASSVLTTDLAWPAYVQALQQVAERRSAALHIVPLQRLVFSEKATTDDVVGFLTAAMARLACDGLFLTDISYLGVRLPLEQLFAGIPDHDRPFVVIDGAQAICHRPLNLSALRPDLFLAGTQKWFRAYHPLRVAMACRQETQSSVRAKQRHLLGAGALQDSLFQFTEAIMSNDFGSFGETVNVAPLIAAAGALRQLGSDADAHQAWTAKRENVKRFAEFLATARWRPELPHDLLRSGIALLRRTVWNNATRFPTEKLREGLARQGITASVFPSGLLRFSMPDFFLSGQHLALVCRALHQIA